MLTIGSRRELLGHVSRRSLNIRLTQSTAAQIVLRFRHGFIDEVFPYKTTTHGKRICRGNLGVYLQ